MNGYYSMTFPDEYSYLEHHGIMGQKWGVRRYQNTDGSLTSAGESHRAKREGTSDSTKDSFYARSNKIKKVTGTVNTAAGVVRGVGMWTKGIGAVTGNLGAVAIGTAMMNVANIANGASFTAQVINTAYTNDKKAKEVTDTKMSDINKSGILMDGAKQTPTLSETKSSGSSKPIAIKSLKNSQVDCDDADKEKANKFVKEFDTQKLADAISDRYSDYDASKSSTAYVNVRPGGEYADVVTHDDRFYYSCEVNMKTHKVTNIESGD